MTKPLCGAVALLGAALLLTPGPALASKLGGWAGAASGAVTTAVPGPAVDLAAEEAAGGHTMANHVGRTEAQLRARLAAEPRISAASSFRTLAEAERFVSEALRANASAIESWARNPAILSDFAITYRARTTVGYGILRSTRVLQPMRALRAVLRKTTRDDQAYFVLTAYPTP